MAHVSSLALAILGCLPLPEACEALGGIGDTLPINARTVAAVMRRGSTPRRRRPEMGRLATRFERGDPLARAEGIDAILAVDHVVALARHHVALVVEVGEDAHAMLGDGVEQGRLDAVLAPAFLIVAGRHLELVVLPAEAAHLALVFGFHGV